MTKTFMGCAPANFRKGRPASFRPEAIVIHIMAGSLNGTNQWFASSAAGVSAHYGVGKKGEVHQYVHEEDTAFHAGTVDYPSWAGIRKTSAGQFINPNFYTIGIEHEGYPGDDWPAAQQASSAALIAEMAARWRIPLDRQHVIGHHEIRQSKPCPGAKAPMDELIRQALAAGPALEPAPMEVTAIVNLNVRAGLPHMAAPVRKVITAGTVLPVAGFTAAGQAIRNNPYWYQDLSGDYFWAGNTNRPNPAV